MATIQDLLQQNDPNKLKQLLGQYKEDAPEEGMEVEPMEAQSSQGSASSPNSFPLPNGGLSDDSVKEYIKANPGPVATIGNNPNNPSPIKEEKEPSRTLASSEEDEQDDDNADSKEENSSGGEDEASAASPVQKLMSSIKPDPIGSIQNMYHAQEAQRNADLVNRLGKASEIIGTGIGGLGTLGHVTNAVAQGLYDDNIKANAQIPQQLKELIDFQKHDPNSDVSKMLRDFFQSKLKIKVPDGASLADLEKIYPPIFKIFEREEQIKSRKEIAQQRAEIQKLMLGNRLSEQSYGHLEKAQNALSKTKEYTNAKTGLDAANELDSVLDQIKTDPNTAKVLSQSIPVIAARMLTHGQRVNQAEISALTGDPSFGAALNRIITKASTGVMTDNDYNQFKQLTAIYKKSAADEMGNWENEAAKRLSRLNNKPVAENYTNLTGRQPANASMNDTTLTPEEIQWGKQNSLTPDQVLSIKKKKLIQGQ